MEGFLRHVKRELHYRLLARVFAALCLFIFISSTSFAAEKLVMDGIQKLLSSENEARIKLDKDLLDSLTDLQKVSATNAKTKPELFETEISRHEEHISNNKSLLVENHLRIEFLNSFLAALDKTSDVRRDSSAILLDMSHRDLTATIESGNDSKVWLFEIYLSIAIRDIMEPSENLPLFIKNYIVYSSLNDPKSPAQFLKDRKYIGIERPENGSDAPAGDDDSDDDRSTF